MEPNEGVSHHDSSLLNSASWLDFLHSHVPMVFLSPTYFLYSALPQPALHCCHLLITISPLFFYAAIFRHIYSVSPLCLSLSLSRSHGSWWDNWKQRFFIEKMLRPVRWKALLIDLCSLLAHTHMRLCKHLDTQRAYTAQCGCSHAHTHTHTYSSPWRPSFLRSLSFPVDSQ